MYQHHPLRRLMLTLAFFLACALSCVIPSSATPIGDQLVPVEVHAAPLPRSQAPLPLPPSANQSQVVAPQASQPPLNASEMNTVAAPGVMSQISTNLLDRVEANFASSLNASVVIGQWLYIRIAIISIVFAIIGWMIAGESITGLIRLVYFRILEASLWLAFIGWTWNGPLGLPGWFPAIIGSLADFGVQIAHQASGIPMTMLDREGYFHLAVLPGAVLDLGASFFGAVGTLAWSTLTGGGLLPNTNLLNVATNTVHAITATVLGALTGTLITNIVIYVFMMLSAIYAYITCAFIAARYFVTIIRIYGVGCLAFLQGFAGSRRFSGYAGGYVSIAITTGTEFALTSIIMGIFYNIIILLIQQTDMWPVMAQIMMASSAVTGITTAVVITAWAKSGMSLGLLIFLDLIIFLWAYTTLKVPSMVTDFFKGRISASDREFERIMNSSTLGGKIVGSGMQAGRSVADHGTVQSASDVARSIAAIGMAAAATQKQGKAGMAEGAFRGGMLGGIPGAVAGAAAAYASGAIDKQTAKNRQAQSTASDGTNTSPNETNETPDNPSSSSSRPGEQSQPGSPASGGSQGSSDDTGILQFWEDGVKQWNAHQEKLHKAAERAKRAAGPILNDVDGQMQTGDMIAKRIMGNAQYRSNRPYYPPSDEQSESLPPPRTDLGGP